jgi:hypothetical protein
LFGGSRWGNWAVSRKGVRLALLFLHQHEPLLILAHFSCKWLLLSRGERRVLVYRMVLRSQIAPFSDPGIGTSSRSCWPLIVYMCR